MVRAGLFGAVVGVVVIHAACMAADSLPAFPGAEGCGAMTVGGRGGKVYVVTHLDDSGPGSLREACEAREPRIIVFNVGGYITLKSDIEIGHPFCTIAGQTALGDGVCVRGGGISILTHDVVVRYLRFRMGRLFPDKPIGSFRDCLRIHGRPASYHVVVDHCSISWGASRNIITWNDAHDITVQWCMISESLRGPEVQPKAYGGMGFLVGDRTKRISIHHCLFAHNYQRNPRLKHGVHAELVNNVIYNWDDGGASLIGDFNRLSDAPEVRANFVNNWYQAGVNTRSETPVVQAMTRATLHVAGNVSNHRWYLPDLNESLQWIELSDTPMPSDKVTTWSAREAFDRVLARAGADRPRRDAVDARVVKEVREGSGHHIRHEDEVGGWPALRSDEVRLDSDADGMPDVWEKRCGLDTEDAADASGDRDGDGYTNIEEWANHLAGLPPASRPAQKAASERGGTPMEKVSDKKVYGVGILGNCCTHGSALCGKFMHHPRTRVVAAYEKHPRRARELQERLGAPLAGSYEAVIRDPDVDFVAIACDPCDKADMVEQSAAAGKPIFLNKPLCDNLNNARRIAAAVKARGVPFVHDIPMVRFIPVYARLLSDVQAGRYGKVMGYHHLFGMNFAPGFDLKSYWPERLDPPARSGGGEMTNMGCYAIDYAVSLFGRPKAVTAKWRKEWDVYREADVEHFGQIILDYGDFFAFLEVGKQQMAAERRHSNLMTINFEHTALLIDASAHLVTINHVPQDYGAFVAGAEVVGPVEQLIGAIEEGTCPNSDVETGVLATETLMAAYRSIVENRTITLPLSSGDNPLASR